MRIGQIYKVLTSPARGRITGVSESTIEIEWIVDSDGRHRTPKNRYIYTRQQIEGAVENRRSAIVDPGDCKLSINPNVVFNRKVKTCL